MGAHLLDYGHVQLFSPWRYNLDRAMVRRLSLHGWEEPELDGLPLARDVVEKVLKPFASLPEVEPFIRLRHRVVSVTRDGYDKMKTEGGRLELVKDFRVAAISRHEGKLTVHATGADGSKKGIEGVDEIICATGQRPNLEMTSELRLKLDPWLESAAALGPLIDPNVHSCGTVRPHGHRELSHPESGFYAIGVKSYGRAPTFLMTTGFEQARSLVAALAGDIESADRVELVLPETGVCSSHLGDDAGSCCGVGLAADVVSDEPARVESSQCCATVDRGRAIKIPVTSRACCG